MKNVFYGLIAFLFVLTSCGNKFTGEPFTGEDLTKIAQIEIDKNTKITHFEIDTQGKWTLFSGHTPDSIDYSTPILTGTGPGKFNLPVPAYERTYYYLQTKEGTALLAERHLPIAGAYNFRDLGGIRNKDGKFTKWGKIFRSDDLHRLTETDASYLGSIPLISIVDFRSPQEIEAAPDTFPSTVKKDYAYCITPGNLRIDSIQQMQPSQVDSMMIQMNVAFVTDTTYSNRYKDFFKLLQNEEHVPLAFHCTAGKDRTGMASALVLYALNVDDERIMEDYMASNKYLEDKYGDIKKEYPALKSLFEVKPEFLHAGIDRIKKDHGSVENFLKNVLGVDIEKFRELYLY